MTRRKLERLTVYTSGGSATYRTRSKAFAAARWVAGESGESVAVANEVTGERWDVSPNATGRTIDHL
jgi:hypothetical protein